MAKYLIIGNGVAGTEAAITIRKMDPDAKIIIFAESSHLLYYRPKLVEYIGSSIESEKLRIYDSNFYAEKQIEINLNTRIVSIDTKEQLVTDTNGNNHHYDRLLLATGAKSFVPPVKGVPIKGAFSLRNFKDADAINARATDSLNAVVAGGGLLGLETAFSLKRMCDTVTVVEVAKSLLPRQLDPEGGQFLQSLLMQKGLRFICGTTVESAIGDNEIEAIKLSTDETIDADILVFSAGIRPDCDLARDAGLLCERGIVVNDALGTSVPGVYAAGDCIQFDNKIFGLWISSKEQGQIAGSVMSGSDEHYSGAFPSVMLKITGIDLFSAGDISLEDVQTESLKTDSVYKKIFYRDNEAVGIIVIGDQKAVIEARKVMKGTVSVDSFIKTLK
ncbi:MAG: FAD-dependent oxidoreductase [Spirochaetes bacterium]|jgi:nitrite reductase (NADH) large subunit|nr:FAD-dependent oxidoreductase [Spirochaetota bacterium]